MDLNTTTVEIIKHLKCNIKLSSQEDTALMMSRKYLKTVHIFEIQKPEKMLRWFLSVNVERPPPDL